MNVVILECVAGKDDRQRMVIGENPVKIAHAELQPGFPVTELDPSQGFLLARVDKGVLLINAANCIIPVYVNDRPVTSAPVQASDILRFGGTVWRARYNSGVGAGNVGGGTAGHAGTGNAGGGAAGAGKAWAGGAGAGKAAARGALKKGFNDLIGLESLHDFNLGNIFSEVFKKHTAEEMEDQLITGTTRHTPALADLEVGWGKPWLFARLLAGSVILSVILNYGVETFQNIKLVPALIFMGSFAIPVSTLMFFVEMNVPRNVSIFKVMQLLFIGGVASLIVALIFFDRLDFFTTFLGASAAGIIEESAKLLVVIFMLGKSSRYPWILNGLLAGAAVATGFAAFESSGFAFKDMVESRFVAVGVETIKIRGILSPFGHIVWTASTAAALWRVKGNRPFTWDMLKAPAFLRILIFVMLLHMTWNAPFRLLPLPLVDDLKYLILGAIGWVVCFRLMQTGLQQLNKARQELALPPVAGPETVRLNNPA